MESQDQLFSLFGSGAVEGLTQAPKLIETVISRVYLFDAEDVVLKIYKRDNAWWNTAMRDLSGGPSRAEFIRQDFAFNQHLNPEIYLALKRPTIVNQCVVLVDPSVDDDELVIVMKKIDLTGTLTDLLFQRTCTPNDYRMIGETHASTLLSIPRSFLPNVASSWHDQLQNRCKDVVAWVESEEQIPTDLRITALAHLHRLLDHHQPVFENMTPNDLCILTDCNSENLIFRDGKLSFIDTYSPKDEWRMGAFELNIYRTGADIYALAGKEAYDAYLEGVRRVAGKNLQEHQEAFYLLYAALIDGPYLCMLAKKDPKYLPKAERYLTFLQALVAKLASNANP